MFNFRYQRQLGAGALLLLAAFCPLGGREEPASKARGDRAGVGPVPGGSRPGPAAAVPAATVPAGVAPAGPTRSVLPPGGAVPLGSPREGDPPGGEDRPFVLGSDLFAGPMAMPREPELRLGEDYLIGCGDRLALTTFGSLALDRVLTVDRGGRVSLPEAGILPLAGLTLAQARAAVKSALARGHGGVEQFSLQVAALHDVQVFVAGEVSRPGAYLVPASRSAVALLGMAGGPGRNGSYRRITHLRGERTVQTLDLYALRFRGRGLQGPAFQDGDCLFVPLAGCRILAQGAFRRTEAPAGIRMELAPGEHAAEAVAFAGGLVPAASRILLTVQRSTPEGITRVEDLPNEPAALGAATLFEGDLLRALPRRERSEAFVELRGAVAVPGRFAYRAGMRVRNLLTLKVPGDQLLPRSYRLRGELLRTGADGATRLRTVDLDLALRGEADQDVPLEPRDRLEVADLSALRRPRTVSVLGPLARPGAYPWHAGMRASDLLFLAGMPEPWASRHEAELARSGPGDAGSIRRLDLARLLATEAAAPAGPGDEAEDPVLRPDDRITVFEDPSYRIHPTVRITGQVARPGPYVLAEGAATLGALVQRAGGLTREAMPAGAVLLRAQPPGDPPAEAALQSMNGILQRLNETRRAKDTGAPEPGPLLHGLMSGETRRVVVDLEAILAGDGRQDAALQDGDVVHVPRRMDSVVVAGEVATAFSTFHLRPGDRVRDVLKLAGGYTRNADKGQVRLLRASGRLEEGRVGRACLRPGDAVLVPQKLRKDVPWQDSLMALTPLVLLYDALRH